MATINSTRIRSSFRTIIRRYHLTIFVLVVLILLTVAVLMLSNILNDATLADDYTSPIQAGSIDETTLQRIDALHTSDGPYPAPTSTATRSNPFGE